MHCLIVAANYYTMMARHAHVISEATMANEPLRTIPVTNPLGGLWRGLDRLIATPRRLFFEAAAARDGCERNGVIEPKANVAESPDAYEITVDIPGAGTDDITVTCRDGTVMISGRVRVDRGAASYHLRERDSGAFSRVFRLPPGVDEDSMEASYAAGVVTVFIPKAESGGRTDASPTRQ